MVQLRVYNKIWTSNHTRDDERVCLLHSNCVHPVGADSLILKTTIIEALHLMQYSRYHGAIFLTISTIESYSNRWTFVKHISITSQYFSL